MGISMYFWNVYTNQGVKSYGCNEEYDFELISAESPPFSIQFTKFQCIYLARKQTGILQIILKQLLQQLYN